jgi:hypothetical protein
MFLHSDYCRCIFDECMTDLMCALFQVSVRFTIICKRCQVPPRFRLGLKPPGDLYHDSAQRHDFGLALSDRRNAF